MVSYPEGSDSYSDPVKGQGEEEGEEEKTQTIKSGMKRGKSLQRL